MLLRPLILLPALALAAALPAAASAKTFCVVSAPTPACANTSLTAALAAAQIADGADVVSVGPGTFIAPGGFHYDGGAGNAVEIAGAGKETLLRATPDGAFMSALNALRLSAPGAVVRDLRLAQPPSSGAVHGYALTLIGGEARDVATTRDPGALGTAVSAGGAVLRRVDVEAAGDFALAMWRSRLEDSRVRSAFGVLVTPDVEPSVIVRSRVDAELAGVASMGSIVALQDSLVRVSGDGTGLKALDAGGKLTGTVDARRVTLVGPGTGVGAQSHGTGAGGAMVTLRDSLLAGFTYPGRVETANQGSGPSAVVLERSVLPPGPSGAGVGEVDVLRMAAPAFADPAGGDYTLAAGSPVLDFAGADDSPGASATDLLGRPRVADGDGDGVALPDPGAFERPAPAPPGGGGGDGGDGDGAGGGAPPAADTASPSVSGLRVALRRHRARARFTLSEPARVTLVLARRRDGRFRTLRTVVRDRAAGPGAVRLGERRPGRHRLRVVAVDPAGNASAASGVRFRVR